MSKFTVITDRAVERALEIAGQAGDSLKQAGSSLRHAAPQAGEWLKSGAAIGAVKTGSRVASKLARRNPAVTIAAAVAGLGLIGYAVYRKRKSGQDAIDSNAQRIEAHRGNASARRAARAQARRAAATPSNGGEA